MVEKGGKVQKYDEGFKVLNETKEEEETIFFGARPRHRISENVTKSEFFRPEKIGWIEVADFRSDRVGEKLSLSR